MRAILSLGAICATLFGAVLTADAQQDFLMMPTDGNYKVGLRFIHPDFEMPEPTSWDPVVREFDTFSGVYDLFCVIPCSRRWSLVLDAPYLRFCLDGRDNVETAFGNVYLGARYDRIEERSRRTFQLGLTAPTSQKNDRNILALATIVNYHESYKYVPGGVCFYGATSYHLHTPSHLLLGYDIGTMIMKSTAYDYSDVDFFWRYGADIGYAFSQCDIRAGFMGVFLMTADVASLDSDFWTDVIIKGTWNRGVIRPSVFYRIPLQHDVQDLLNATLGIQLDLAFGGA